MFKAICAFFKAKYVDLKECEKLFKKYKNIVTVEEQTLSGGLGSLVLEIVSDLGMKKTVERIGLEERYYFENGGRDFLLDKFDKYGIFRYKYKKFCMNLTQHIPKAEIRGAHDLGALERLTALNSRSSVLGGGLGGGKRPISKI